MLRRMYDWVLAQAEAPYALWVLAGIAFAESSFFPLPPDILLIPMVLARPRRAFLIAGVATVSSVLGGYLGYAIGYYLYDTVGGFIIDHLASRQGLDATKEAFDRWGFWAIVIKGATPIPYKLVTILSGFLRFDLVQFTIASLIARAMRFFLWAVLLAWFGEPIRAFVERRLGLAMTAAVVALVGGFVVLKLI